MGVKLSVIVLVYNHEKYIRKAMDGILEQIIDFDYEVLIGEDCSTDGSREILMEYEKVTPDNYRYYYRNKNIGAKRNFKDLYERATGEYIIILEADDYWTYNQKLKRQVAFLENNSEYIACAHNAVVVNEMSVKTDIKYPECKDYEYTLDHYLYKILPGQLTTLMFRNYYKHPLINYDLENESFPGDMIRSFELVSQGKIFCFQKKWSAYRYVTKSGSSFSANHKGDSHDVLNAISFYKAQMNWADKRINNPYAKKVSECLYLSAQFLFVIKGGGGIGKFIIEYSNSNVKLMFLLYFFRRMIMLLNNKRII